jgi:hypothetical protein
MVDFSTFVSLYLPIKGLYLETDFSFKVHLVCSSIHSLSKHGLETPLKSLFYLFVRVYAVLCAVHGQ